MRSMSSHLLAPESYGRESSIDSDETAVQDRLDYESDYLTKHAHTRHFPRWLHSLRTVLSIASRRVLGSLRGITGLSRRSRSRNGPPSLLFRRVTFLSRIIFGIVLTLIIYTGFFQPSYTQLPAHYNLLRSSVIGSQETGRGNPSGEHIFISCALYDKNGHLAGGSWGDTILQLIDILGPENVFLSIYENDSGEAGTSALADFKAKVKCDHEIVSELHVPPDPFPTVRLPDGSERHKRIPYLAEMRNRALRPLDKYSKPYDKVLIINDVFFDPLDAAQLLFSTHIGQNGKADYLAACAVDFINPFKFYDTFATRDLDGYSMGVPFYPWFSTASRRQSRQDVLDQKDAVRVKSCWGGMAVFDARYFQSFSAEVPDGFQGIGSHEISPSNPKPVTAPVRFRSEPEIFFDACECCLLHADVLRLSKSTNVEDDTRIYMNPFIRVAYDPTTLSWLGFTRRFERLYSIPHWIVSVLARLPTYNPHRAVEEGEQFDEEVWISDATSRIGGSWQITNRTARNGLYCGVREMQVLLQKQREDDKNWENTPIPAGRRLW